MSGRQFSTSRFGGKRSVEQDKLNRQKDTYNGLSLDAKKIYATISSEIPEFSVLNGPDYSRNTGRRLREVINDDTMCDKIFNSDTVVKLNTFIKEIETCASTKPELIDGIGLENIPFGSKKVGFGRDCPITYSFTQEELDNAIGLDKNEEYVIVAIRDIGPLDPNSDDFTQTRMVAVSINPNNPNVLTVDFNKNTYKDKKFTVEVSVYPKGIFESRLKVADLYCVAYDNKNFKIQTVHAVSGMNGLPLFRQGKYDIDDDTYDNMEPVEANSVQNAVDMFLAKFGIKYVQTENCGTTNLKKLRQCFHDDLAKYTTPFKGSKAYEYIKMIVPQSAKELKANQFIDCDGNVVEVQQRDNTTKLVRDESDLLRNPIIVHSDTEDLAVTPIGDN